MKTYLKYGAMLAGGGFLLVVLLFLVGLHSSTSGLKIAQWIQICGGLAIGITCTVLGIKARRAEVPATEEFGYGQALGAGVMITLFAALLGIVTTLLYGLVVNPGFSDLLLRAQAEGLEARGLSAEKIEQIQKMSAMWMKPPVQAAFGFVGGMLFGTVISLISAAFLKRPSANEIQPVSA